MKKLLRKITYSNDLIFMIYYTYLFKPRNELQRYLDSYSRSLKGDIFFIQIGANDGITGDPLYKFIRRDRWNGVLIEPQKEVYGKLKNNYKDFSGLQFENAAISDKTGKKKIYKLSFTNARWASGIASIRKEDLQREIDNGYIEKRAIQDGISLPENKNQWITNENIYSISFQDLIVKYNISNINLLAIDTEGYDYEIIKTIPFDHVNIENIIYEHKHFDNVMKTECESYLRELGYNITAYKTDTLANK